MKYSNNAQRIFFAGAFFLLSLLVILLFPKEVAAFPVGDCSECERQIDTLTCTYPNVAGGTCEGDAFTGYTCNLSCVPPGGGGGGGGCYGEKTGPCGGGGCAPNHRYYYQYCESSGWHSWCTLPNDKQPSCSCTQQSGLRVEYFKKGTGYSCFATESFQPWTANPGPVSYAATIDRSKTQSNTEGFCMRYGAILDNQTAANGRGYIYFPVPGNWTFTVTFMWRDTGQFWVNNQLVINGWGYWKPCGFPCPNGASGTINIATAGWYPIQLNWNAGEEQGHVHLYWQGPPGSGVPKQIVPTGNLSSCQAPVSCTVDLLPATATVQVGSNTALTASVSPSGGGSIDRVDFVSGNGGIVSVNPSSDATAVYSTEATGVAAGSTTVRADVIMSGSTACTDTSTVSVTATANPWWQVKDADVTSGGDIISPIPGSCTLPVCNPVFDLKGTGGFPGVPVYAGATADFQAGAGVGTAGETYNWLANTAYLSSKAYDFAYFKRQIPSDVTFTEITTPTVNGGDFNSGGAPSRGYVWYHYDGATLGDMTISGNVNLTGSRRVVLMVEGADLYINGLVNLNSPGSGFFMAVVGKDVNGQKGNIIVDPSVSHPSQPAMEGVFLAEGQFRSGAGTNRFYFRGSLAAYGGVTLERDLGGVANTTAPAEIFEYSPAIMATFPQVFTTRRIRWKEVAP